MGHIEDRWYKTVVHDDRTTEKVKTELYGKGMRYRARYLDPDGRERKKSFPDRAYKKAEAFLTTVEADVLRGNYLDPLAGRILFKDYAEEWLRTRVFDESSREGVEIRVRRHLYPYFGAKSLGSIKPGHVREW